MKASQFGRQQTRGALQNGRANLTAKKPLRRTNQVPGSKEFCTAWNWKLTLDTNLANRLAMAVHRQQTNLGRSSVLWCFTKSSLISKPFTLKGHSFCSRIFEITLNSDTRKQEVVTCLGCAQRKGTRENHAAMFLSVCVGLHSRLFVIPVVPHEAVPEVSKFESTYKPECAYGNCLRLAEDFPFHFHFPFSHATLFWWLEHKVLQKSTIQYCSVLHSTAPYYKAQHSTTPYYKVLSGTKKYYNVLHNTTPYYKVVHSSPHYKVLLRTTKNYKVLHNATPYYKVRHSTTPYYKVPHSTFLH